MQACPNDDGTLDPLLGLCNLLHQAGVAAPAVAVAQVCSQLLTNNVPGAQIVPAVQYVPDLLTTVPRSTAIVAFRHAGGADADARLAAHVAGADDAALVSVLSSLPALVAIAHFAMLDQPRKEAVIGERTHLTTDVLRVNAITTAAAAADGPTAVQALAQTRAFGFRADFASHADRRAGEARQVFEAAEAKRIHEQAERDRVEAFESVRTAAVGALSTKFARMLESSELTEKGKQGRAKLAEDQRALSAGAVATINVGEQQQLQHVQQTTGPGAADTRREQFRAWFASVDFHPDALSALDASADKTGLATSVITAIDADGRVRQLLIGSGLSVDELAALIAITPARLGTLVAGGLTAAEFQAFAASAARVSVLDELARALMPVANVRGLVAHLKPLEAQITGEPAHLVALLSTTVAADVVELRDALPAPDNVRLALLRVIRPKAAVAADMAPVLRFCKDARWTHAEITGAFAPLAAAQGQPQLYEAVHAAELARHQRLTGFAGWLYSVNRLVGAGYLTIQPRGVWVRLPGDRTITDEQKYRVVNVATGAVVGTFRVHFHPNAIPPDTNNPNSSRSHLKPERGGDIRYYTPEMLPHIKARIELRPPRV